MKKLTVLMALLFSLPALAGSWISATPDRFNLLYTEGEQAEFRLQLLHQPTNPAFEIKVSVEEVGVTGPVEVDFANGHGIFSSTPLAAGTQEIRIHTRLIGPGSWEEVVEEKSWHLTVAPEAL